MRESFVVAATAAARPSEALIEKVIRGRDRSRPHLTRKLYHAFMGLTCFFLYALVLTQEQALVIILAIGGPLVILDVARLKNPKLRAAALQLFGPVMRCEELERVSGNSYFVLGLFTVVLLFPKSIALLSILYLGLGDPAAAIVGTTWGKHHILGSKKSLEGGLGNFLITGLATFLVALCFWNLNVEKALLIGAVGGAASMIAEALPLIIDDNFTIPVISAALLSLAGGVLTLF